MTDSSEVDRALIGRLVRKARQSLGMTQRELANQSGTSERSVRGLERDGRHPRSMILELVITALTACGADVTDLHQVIAIEPVIRSDASVARPSVIPAQLPIAVGEIAGRAAQVKWARSVVTPESVQVSPAVLVVTGKPGVGKSTLAIQIGHAVRESFPDGQLFASLGAASGHSAQPSMVLAQFLRALGAEELPPAAERASLFRSMTADRALLLVLDDAGDEAGVRPLLPAGNRCAVVVTSRARLTGLDATQLVLDVLDTPDAVQLLAMVVGTDRVAADPAGAARVTQLCGSLPLAVRIAAARLAARPHWRFDRLADRLADDRTRLDTLATGDREVRATLASACAGLSSELMRALLYLGVLPVPDFASWLAAAALDRPLGVAEDIADALVEAHLLDVVHGPQHTVRYRFHDLLRVYAQERAQTWIPPNGVAVDTPAAAVHRACSAALSAAEQLATAVHHRLAHPGGEAALPYPVDLANCAIDDPLGWFDTEITTLLALLQHAHDTPELNRSCWQLASALNGYLEVRGDLVRWHHALHLALSAARRGGDRAGHAATLRAMGELHVNADRLADAMTCYRRAQTLVAGLGDRLCEAHLHRGMAYVHLQRGELADATDAYTRALATFTELDDHAGQADAATGLGTIHHQLGHHDQARDYFDTALRAYRLLGEHLGYAATSVTAGSAEIAAHRYTDARRRLIEGLTAARTIHHDGTQAYLLLALGDLYRCLRQYRRARATLVTARRFADRAADRYALIGVLRNQGRLDTETGDFTAAHYHLTQALAIADEIDVPLIRATVLDNLGDIHHLSGDAAQAHQAWTDAHTAYTAIGSPNATTVARKLTH
ncbi:MAG TPA: tetratricopeptide repeat protein [Pseudonocardiaceae bacterium]|nr:tetratricopeptide repeat protein [Pseudonocardiaceae bacterium]